MKDFLGNKVEIGDEVVITRKLNTTKVSYIKGKVTGFTNSKIAIEMDKTSIEDGDYVSWKYNNFGALDTKVTPEKVISLSAVKRTVHCPALEAVKTDEKEE